MNQLYRVIWVVCLLATAVFLSAPPRPAYAATFVVTKTADTADGTCNADCSLREAIIAANAAAGADVITVPAGTYTLSIAGTGENAGATGDLDITGNLTINGAGASTTIINANSIDRVFHGVTTAGTTLTVAISDITIRGGNLPAGIANMGGGFASDSTTTGNTNLTLNNVQISNNTTGNNGGAVGFIKNIGASNHVLTLNNSTITANTALNGGGINCAGCTLTVNSSTISGNGASTSGGGINITVDTSNVNLTNSTISGNTANGNGGGIAKILGTGIISLNFTTVTNNTADNEVNGAGDGGGISAISNTTLQNSIVQGNLDSTTPATSDCNGTITSNGYNVVGSGTGCPSGGTGDSTAAANLGALQNNGASINTHLPGGGSAAINRVPNGSSGCNGGVSVDQRGGVRADGLNRGDTACDSGSVEADSTLQPNAVALQLLSTEANSSARWAIFLFALLVLASLGVMGQRPFGQLARKLTNKI